MQGKIFNAVADLVIEKFGFEIWDQIIKEANLESNGVYTAGGNYPDDELFTIVGLLSQKTDIPVKDLVYTAGHFAFSHLLKFSSYQVKDGDNVKDFLIHVDKVIHVGIKQLYPDAYLPELKYDDSQENHLTLFYHSKRKLCWLAEGLIQGAADHFNNKISLEHVKCMHDGAASCQFELQILAST